MRKLLLMLVALAGCQKTDPLYCGKHPGVCDDGGNFLIDAQALATIGGTVSGIGAASGLVLQNNLMDDKPVLSDGAFRFPTQIPIGSMYDVTVSVQPTNPSENCTVANGSGTADGDISNVAITCAPLSYTIGGSVVGLSGSVMLHNGSDTITVSTNGTFTFPTKVQSGQMYTVTASGNAACAVFGGTGTVGNGDVTSITVNCAGTGGPYVIGGTIRGLNGTVVLKNTINNDTVMVTSTMTATYAFPMPVPSGGAYNVIVQTQPAYPPATQNCVVAFGSGNAGGNIQNIDVTCTTLSFTVGGSISGIGGAGTVTLQNNLADDLNLTTDSGFTFATALQSGTSYAVTVKSQPATRSCSVSRATGTVASSNVTNVSVTCAYADPGILCGTSTYCQNGTQACCQNGGATCISSGGSCGGAKLQCDSKADCSGSNICCELTNGGHNQFGDSTCKSVSSCNSSGAVEYLCDPNATSPCVGINGTTCKPWMGGYYSCQ